MSGTTASIFRTCPSPCNLLIATGIVKALLTGVLHACKLTGVPVAGVTLITLAWEPHPYKCSSCVPALPTIPISSRFTRYVRARHIALDNSDVISGMRFIRNSKICNLVHAGMAIMPRHPNIQSPAWKPSYWFRSPSPRSITGGTTALRALTICGYDLIAGRNNSETGSELELLQDEGSLSERRQIDWKKTLLRAEKQLPSGNTRYR